MSRLIDADALINTLQELFDKREKEAKFTGNRGMTVTWNDAIYHIKTAPTIEERKRGKWIKMPYHVTECSECGFSLEDWIQGAFYNYCPNCGANMRGEE